MSDTSAERSRNWSPTVRQLADEAAQSLQLRRELAELELGHDRALLTRFACVGGVAMSLVIVGVTLLLVMAAWELSQITALSFSAWLALLGTVTLVPGAFWLARSVLRVRQEFCGLRGTLAELREDLAWWRDWTIQDSATSPTDGPDGGDPSPPVA